MSATLNLLKTGLLLAVITLPFSVSANDTANDDSVLEAPEDCEKPDITATKYTDVSCMYGDVAIVRVGDSIENTRFGVINADGREVIAPEYNYFKVFSDDLFVAIKDGKQGIISKTGKVMLPVIYDFVDTTKSRGQYFEEHAIIQTGNSFDSFKQGLVNSQGQIVIAPKYRFIDSANDINKQLLSVGVKVGDSTDDIKYGLVTYSDQIIVPLVYDAPIRFNGKWAKICKDQRCNFINTKGELLLRYWVDQYEVGNFSESMALVKQDGRFGYINESGEIAIPFIYSKAKDFEQGRAIVVYDDENLTVAPGIDEVAQVNTYGVIDQDNRVIVPFEYQWITRVKPNLFYVQNSDGFSFVDYDGNLATTKKFDEVVPISLYNELVAIKKEGKWGFINKNFETVVPFEYDKAVEFEDDLAAVKKGDKFGFIDKTGEIVVPFEYDDPNLDVEDWRTSSEYKYRFDSDMTVVRKNGYWGVINKDNNIIVPFEYDDVVIETFSQIKATKEGVDYLFDQYGSPIEDDRYSLD